MTILGAERLAQLAGGELQLKLVFNASGAIIFDAAQEHRDQKSPGLSYEDDYRGNALAAMLRSDRIEVRYHARFSDEQVKSLLTTLLGQPEMQLLRSADVVYQGRLLILNPS